MGLDDRLFWLCVGCLIGFVSGYIVRSLRDFEEELHEIKEELDEVDEIVKRKFPSDESGRLDLSKALLMVVVTLTAFAAFYSQNASNQSKESVKKSDAALAEQVLITTCTQELLIDALDALNQRSIYTVSQTQANVNLQKDAKQFLALILHIPPYGEARQFASAQAYFESVTSFIEVANQSIANLETNDYPEAEDLTRCVAQAKQTGEPNGAQ